ncbi:hypothetical protein PYCCODRAFT_1383488 [Trametes coccinea BRFM310]|uniref:F-box domain-containing protein n=1 Tax=Trametes coccinea (strain BRFM310) TaxID=1353009 RepID=A0A1Y2J0P3_TRAC3|nr:hypothetical protein PYCCODRAFT_1383488 [Trametes coccinea BRFM310]
MDSTSPRLPPELCDLILDQLHEDKRALRVCALTSHDWLTRAQFHLFRSIYLDWSNCYSFSRLLSNNPSLADHMKTLEIEGAFGIFSMDRLHGATLDAWLRSVPPWLPHRLTNLTNLELALLTIDADLVHRFFGQLPSVTHLTLWACALTTFDVFAELFLSLPRIKRLSIAFIQEWEANPHPVSRAEQGRSRPQLEVIELTSSCDNFKVLKWLVDEGLHHGVRTLSCTRVPWAGLGALGDALRAFAPNLQDLRIGVGDSTTATDIAHDTAWACPTFAPLPSLTTLTLDIHTARLPAVPYTLYLLSQLCVPALRTLIFAVKCGEYDTAALIPWSRIAEVVQGPATAGNGKLNRVLVSVREREGSEPELIRVDTRGRVGVGVDLEEMERNVRAAFEAQGLGKLIAFEHVGRWSS